MWLWGVTAGTVRVDEHRSGDQGNRESRVGQRGPQRTQCSQHVRVEQTVSVLCGIDTQGGVQLHIIPVQRTTLEGIGRISTDPVLLLPPRGGQLRLSRVEEHALADYLMQRGDMALPLTPAAAGEKVKEIVQNRGGAAFSTPTQTPSRCFWRGFRRRNPEVSGRRPQPLTPAKAALSASAVDAFFTQLRDVARRVSVSVRSDGLPSAKRRRLTSSGVRLAELVER
jgi:hypothetical protein